MGLCQVCKALDIALLLRGHSRNANATIPFHADLFYVRRSASNGCGLCKALWTEFSQKPSCWQDGQLGPQLKGSNLIITCLRAAVLYIRVPGVSPAPWAVLQLLRDGRLEYDSEPTSLVPFAGVDKDPTSGLKFASACLKECGQHHSECESNFSAPDRLLAVGNISRDPHLVSLQSRQDNIGVKWAALSYCWGDAVEPMVKLDSDNLSKLEKGVPLEDFDATIRDAIIVTRKLDIPYLWVDSLCIIQQHGSSDWFEQSSRMNQIYGGSYVTIAALDSTSVKEGFLKERNIVDIGLEWKRKQSGHKYRSVTQRQPLLVSTSVAQCDPEGPLLRRGWTMQESLMPNRIIFFSAQGVTWTCQKCVKTESGDSVTPLDDVLEQWKHTASDPGDIWGYDLYTKFKLFSWQLGIRANNPGERFRLWWQIIEQYSPRSFTKMSDRLIAISGVASLYADMAELGDGHTSYYAGIWKWDIPCGLCWRCPEQLLSPERPELRDMDTYFPSWSWASAPKNAIVYNGLANEYFRSMSRLVNIKVELSDPSNPFGSVKSGQVVVEGPLMSLTALFNSRWKDDYAPMSSLERCIASKIDHEKRSRQLQSSLKDEQPDQFVAMILGQAFHEQMNAMGVITSGLERVQLTNTPLMSPVPLAPSIYTNLIVLILRKAGTDSDNQQLYMRHALININTVAWDKLSTGIPLDDYWTNLENEFASFDPSFKNAFKNAEQRDRPFLLAVREAAPKQMPKEFLPHRLNGNVIEDYRRKPWPLGTVTIV
ncbi:HET-domain-containing protein [Pseudovirgaria hyperparasitica]|uniref:HET-domain-containing protein n=1 Tax=Pseudovirgaria hyperparasitica TaxID=470096 RepID=A0A6A6W121_9PEZI|nr:HET-domain-containing protein [Pseudovirgaria hyperparasitica]KAF2755674.1 HET-domain-containing protein [Pseudovirgaria hyperparasitica]